VEIQAVMEDMFSLRFVLGLYNELWAAVVKIEELVGEGVNS
jgi:hypothetical protein